MTRPVASPVTSSQKRRNPAPGAASRDISPPKQSVPSRSNYITAERLYRTLQRMTEIDWLILGFVNKCRLASGSQLIRGHWQTADRNDARSRAGRRVLKRLHDQRVLDTLPRSVGGERGGSAGMIYTVGVAGAKLLDRSGQQANRLEAPGALYIAHTLACTELVVALGEASLNGALECIELQCEPECWRSFLGAMGGRQTLKPDLFVRVAAPESAYEEQWYMEVDMATEAAGTILAKAKRYLAHYRATTQLVHPKVLWAVPDNNRHERIQSIMRRVPAKTREMFSVCLLDEAIDFLGAEARS